jgi:AcrR family transcriptional regulator
MGRRTKALTVDGGAPAPAGAASEGAPKRPRGERRKLATRASLLSAAFKLMAERGIDAIAISEITEAADVGAGSFYNHFESKEAIHAAVTQLVFDQFADALEEHVGQLSDSAEVIAVCVRQTVSRAGKEPDWGRFLLREGYSGRALSQGLGPRLRRDIRVGVASSRFKTFDPALCFAAVGGTILSAVASQVRASRAQRNDELALRGPDIPERTAAMVLVILGLSHDEAKRVANRPLPTTRQHSAAGGGAKSRTSAG